MTEDSPPPIVTFRRHPRPAAEAQYDLALELVGHVHQVIEHAVTRFHLKNRLDREVTCLPMLLAQVRDERPSQQWRTYRIALKTLASIATVLDILARQRCTTAVGDLVAAQLTVHRLRFELRPLGNPPG